MVWWDQVLDICQFWLRGQGRVYTWCWLPIHPGLIIVALKNWSLTLTLIIWIGFCSIFDSRAVTESQICYIYISIESHIWELDVSNVHIIESHFWELNLLYQSYFNAVVKFGILLLNISSYLILYYSHWKVYIITISDCSFYYLKTLNSTTIRRNFYHGQTLDIAVNPR